MKRIFEEFKFVHNNITITDEEIHSYISKDPDKCMECEHVFFEIERDIRPFNGSICNQDFDIIQCLYNLQSEIRESFPINKVPNQLVEKLEKAELLMRIARGSLDDCVCEFLSHFKESDS